MEFELNNGSSMKNSLWSESVAVGDECFIKEIQQRLAGRAQGRLNNETTALKEPQAPYSTLLANKKGLLSVKNAYFLPINY